MTYNEALLDLAKCAENLAAWRSHPWESFATSQAIDYWSGRLTAAIANLDVAWEQEKVAEPITVERS